MIRTLTAALIISVGGCATAPAAIKPSGFVLVREYVDSIKYDTGDQYRKIQYGWDYGAGTAVIQTFDMDGVQLSKVQHPEITLAATQAELEYGFALVRKHPELRKAAARADAKLYGGFAYRNGDDFSKAGRLCLPKSRCIHVVISGGVAGEVFLGHAIVDLAAGKVVIPKYGGTVHSAGSSSTSLSKFQPTEK